MARTKTPQQLHEQWTRVNKYISARWGNKTWMLYYGHVYCRYCLNMGYHNGEFSYWANRRDGFQYNERNNAPVSVEHYTV